MSRFEKLERVYLDIVDGEAKGLLAAVARFFLHLLSWGYKLAVGLRNCAYDRGWLKSCRPAHVAIVSIGNISLGGTGKTPLAMVLSRGLNGPWQQALLSRGYRSRAERGRLPLQISRGSGPEYSAEECGDEPFLLAKNLPGVKVFVGKNRRLSAEMAAGDGAELLILDDGMQHRSLERDFEVVLLDSRRPLEESYHFPRGFLREGCRSLRRADLIVLNNCGCSERYRALSRDIARYSRAPVIAAVPHVVGCYLLDGEAVEALRGKKVALFCGIGNPSGFIETVRGEGAAVVDEYIIGDHRRAEAPSLEEFAKRSSASGAEYVVCTEKDAVKLRGEEMNPAIPIAWVKIELAVLEGKNYWDEFISKVRCHMDRVVDSTQRAC